MSRSPPPRVLSVEDDSDTRLVLKHALEDSYNLTLVSGAEEALAAADTNRFDLLLLDINLTNDRGGVDLLHTLREREDMTRVPAVAVTAYSMPGDRQEFLKEGFDGYLGKPFSLDELRTVVEDTLLSTPSTSSFAQQKSEMG